jgi:hypothetical protein
VLNASGTPSVQKGARKIREYSRIFYEDNNINKGTINCRTYWEVPEYSMHSFAQSE